MLCKGADPYLYSPFDHQMMLAYGRVDDPEQHGAVFWTMQQDGPPQDFLVEEHEHLDKIRDGTRLSEEGRIAHLLAALEPDLRKEVEMKGPGPAGTWSSFAELCAYGVHADPTYQKAKLGRRAAPAGAVTPPLSYDDVMRKRKAELDVHQSARRSAMKGKTICHLTR